MKVWAFVFLSLAATISGKRALLQEDTVPTPAPAPAPAAVTKAPGANCVGEAAIFQTGCATYITALNSATHGAVVATTPAEISALVASINVKPSSACCTAAQNLLADACACDTSVQALAKTSQGLTPQQFQTVGQVFLAACSLPASTDTCDLSSA